MTIEGIVNGWLIVLSLLFVLSVIAFGWWMGTHDK